MELSEKLENKLLDLGRRLIYQQSSRIIVQPLGNSFGYWFGGGNICLSKNGEVLVSGRFRNEGDARTGTGAGARGLECSVFSGNSSDASFEKVLSFSKEDLSHTEEVVSIEGVSLINNPDTDNSYEFMFVAPALPITGAVGSPINPLAIKSMSFVVPDSELAKLQYNLPA